MPKPTETPIPKNSLLASLIAESRVAGLQARDAEIQIWQQAMRRCRGNVTAMAGWMGVDLTWARRHIRRLGLQDDLTAARGR